MYIFELNLLDGSIENIQEFIHLFEIEASRITIRFKCVQNISSCGILVQDRTAMVPASLDHTTEQSSVPGSNLCPKRVVEKVQQARLRYVMKQQDFERLEHGDQPVMLKIDRFCASDAQY